MSQSEVDSEHVSSWMIKFLLNKSEKEVFMMCLKANKQTIQDLIPDAPADLSKIDKKQIPLQIVSVRDFKDVHGIDLKLLIDNIRTKFHKDQKCMEYIYAHVKRKFENKTKLPDVVRLPPELGKILSFSTKTKVIELVVNQFRHSINPDSENPIKVTF